MDLKKILIITFCLTEIFNVNAGEVVKISGIGLSCNMLLGDDLHNPVFYISELDTRFFEFLNVRFSAGKLSKSELTNIGSDWENIYSVSGHTASVSAIVKAVEAGPFSLQLGAGIAYGSIKEVYDKTTIVGVTTANDVIVLHELGYRNEQGFGFDFLTGIECRIGQHFAIDGRLGAYYLKNVELRGDFFYAGFTLKYLINNEKK